MIDWDVVYDAIPNAKGIAFDTCHKIYVLMDDEQMALMKEYEYDPLISKDEMSDHEMFETLKKWYDESCGLRFIQAVETNHEDANLGFTDLIEQGASDEEECEECLTLGCYGECVDEYEEDEEDEEED